MKQLDGSILVSTQKTMEIKLHNYILIRKFMVITFSLTRFWGDNPTNEAHNGITESM